MRLRKLVAATALSGGLLVGMSSAASAGGVKVGKVASNNDVTVQSNDVTVSSNDVTVSSNDCNVNVLSNCDEG